MPTAPPAPRGRPNFARWILIGLGVVALAVGVAQAVWALNNPWCLVDDGGCFAFINPVSDKPDGPGMPGLLIGLLGLALLIVGLSRPARARS